MNYIISIDQSTSATKAVVFDEQCRLVCRKNVAHHQYYPKPGWVEHDAEEIYRNTVEAVREVVDATRASRCTTQWYGSAKGARKYAKTLRSVASQSSSVNAADCLSTRILPPAALNGYLIMLTEHGSLLSRENC